MLYYNIFYPFHHQIIVSSQEPLLTRAVDIESSCFLLYSLSPPLLHHCHPHPCQHHS